MRSKLGPYTSRDAHDGRNEQARSGQSSSLLAAAMSARHARGTRDHRWWLSRGENDVKRWETTQRGPYKLVAVVTHDKYSWELRTEAAMSLIRMPPRGGVRQGIAFLVDKYKDEEGETREGALNQLPEEARRQIVDRMAPLLIKELKPPPPARTPEGRLPPGSDDPVQGRDVRDARPRAAARLEREDAGRSSAPRSRKWASDGLRGPHRERLAAVRPRADDALSRPRERQDAPGHHQREHRAHRPHRRPHQRHRRRADEARRPPRRSSRWRRSTTRRSGSTRRRRSSRSRTAATTSRRTTPRSPARSTRSRSAASPRQCSPR